MCMIDFLYTKSYRLSVPQQDLTKKCSNSTSSAVFGALAINHEHILLSLSSHMKQRLQRLHDAWSFNERHNNIDGYTLYIYICMYIGSTVKCLAQKIPTQRHIT